LKTNSRAKGFTDRSSADSTTMSSGDGVAATSGTFSGRIAAGVGGLR
jgi:hypothetical protein